MALPVKDYENYSVTSQDYDSNRVPVGVEVILGALSYPKRLPLSELHILDAGCGTGNYIRVLSPHLGRVSGLELNEGMLGQVRRKTAKQTNVEVWQGSILNMPFSEGSFDGVICNQVIHHLQPEGQTSHKNVAVFFKEIARVLKPKGVAIINVSFEEQISSMWYTNIIPGAIKAHGKKTPSLVQLQEFFREAGLEVGPTFSLSETLFRADQWMNQQGPLIESWRNTDSVFSLASGAELEAGIQFWRKALEEGTAEQFIAGFEEKRMRNGLSTSLVAYKP